MIEQFIVRLPGVGSNAQGTLVFHTDGRPLEAVESVDIHLRVGQFVRATIVAFVPGLFGRRLFENVVVRIEVAE